METKEFIKQGYINLSFMQNIAVPVKITLAHSGVEYFFKDRGMRRTFETFENCKRVLYAQAKKRKVFKTSGAWFIAKWQYENVTDTGNKVWWNPSKEVLNIIEGEEEINELLSIKPIIEHITTT